MIAAVVGVTGAALAQPPAGSELVPFSTQRPGHALPASWAALTFRNIARHTVYSLVDDAGTTVLRADAQSSASGLAHAVESDASEAGTSLRLHWRWKAPALLPDSNLSRANTDDCVLRLQVSFKLDEAKLTIGERARVALARAFYGIDLPHSTLIYVWDRAAPTGAIIANPATDRARALVVESGPGNLGQWRSHSRDVLEDYRLVFGAEPPRIASIVLMTDTDDTGASATAFYGDVRLERAQRVP